MYQKSHFKILPQTLVHKLIAQRQKHLFKGRFVQANQDSYNSQSHLKQTEDYQAKQIRTHFNKTRNNKISNNTLVAEIRNVL